MTKKQHKSNDWQPKKAYGWTKIHWTASTKHVDEETGEQLTKYQLKNNDYIKTETHKHYTVEKHRPRGHIEYTNVYRRNPQLRLI